MERLYQVLPPLSAEEYENLKADIAARGVQVPVEYDEQGNVLDGHHRLRACQELGVKDWPRVIRAGLTEEGKRTHARQLNLARRHLNQEQKRTLIAEQLKETPEKSDRQVAGKLGVSDKTVGAVRKELEGIAEIPQSDRETADGRIYPRERQAPASIFVTGARQQEKLQQVLEAVQGGDDTAKRVLSALEAGRTTPQAALKQVTSEQQRQQQMEALRREPPELPVGPFRVVVADPPWQYDDTATRGAVEHHYASMTVAAICELPVRDLADEAAHLYLWTTNSHLPEAFRVMEAWGFEYKTLLTWVKPQIGMGHYFRGCTEHVLFGVRGVLGTLRSDARNWFEAPRAEHSTKPEEFYRLVETCSPGPYLELFARRARPHWRTWGDEV